MVGTYYNENDPYCVQWLRNLIKAGLIADGDVDDRDIRLVKPEDVRGYRQAHFFAGLGGWSYALRLAQWPDDCEVWTGSCPCQPFSAAGREAGRSDPRHLWPDWFRIIASSRPPVVFGEQVERAIGHGWLDAVSGDMAREGYEVGAAVLPATSVAAPHIRNRLFFVANTNGPRLQGIHQARGRKHLQPASPPVRRGWAPEPGLARVADGIPRRVVAGRIKGLGNAIVPQVAAVFIEAAREAMMEQLYEAAA